MLVPGGYFPDDLDTTSLALTVLRPHPDVVTSVLDEMIKYVKTDGMIQVSHRNASHILTQLKSTRIIVTAIF